MVELMPNPPLGEEPLEIGRVRLSEVVLENVWSVTPFKGRTAAVSKALANEIGVMLSEVGCLRAHGNVEVLWSGLDQWFVVGRAVNEIPGAAITDQSDNWACFNIRGPVAPDVMARLCPLDLRGFNLGQVARTEFAHMMSLIVARDAGYDIWVMRSFAKTAWHDLSEAARSIEAQSHLSR